MAVGSTSAAMPRALIATKVSSSSFTHAAASMRVQREAVRIVRCLAIDADGDSRARVVIVHDDGCAVLPRRRMMDAEWFRLAEICDGDFAFFAPSSQPVEKASLGRLVVDDGNVNKRIIATWRASWPL